VPHAQRDRHAQQRCGLLDGQIVLVDPIAELRAAGRPRKTDVENDVVGSRYRKGKAGSDRGGAEIAAVERKLLRDEGEHVTARDRSIEPAVDPPRENRSVKQETVARGLRARRPSDRHDGGGGEEQGSPRVATRRHVHPQRQSPLLVPTHTKGIPSTFIVTSGAANLARTLPVGGTSGRLLC